jgi:hypothetical protein
MGTTVIVVVGSIVFAAIVTVMALRRAGILGPRKKVLATGIPGRATIIGITPTGTVINGTNYVCAVQLRVEIPGVTQYDVQTRESVPITAMGMVMPGTVVAVRVDQSDESKVFIDWQAVPSASAAPMPPGQPTDPAAGMPMIGGPVGRPVDASDVAAVLAVPSVLAGVPTGSAADLLRTGEPALGYLTSFSDTHRTPRSLGRSLAPELMDDPLYVLQVELHPSSGSAPICGTVVHRVPRAVTPQLRVGMPLRCAVDRTDPTHRFAIQWDADAAVPAMAGQTWPSA